MEEANETDQHQKSDSGPKQTTNKKRREVNHIKEIFSLFSHEKRKCMCFFLWFHFKNEPNKTISSDILFEE